MDFQSDSPPEKVLAGLNEQLSGASQALSQLENREKDRVLTDIAAQFSYALYVGSGIADPSLSKLKGEQGQLFRTAWAMEAARLLSLHEKKPSPQDLMEAWTNNVILQGPESPEKHGHYVQPIIPPAEAEFCRIPTFGGGSRLCSADISEDLHIAILEALFWLGSRNPESLEPWLYDDRPLLRLTAMHLLRHGTSESYPWEEKLTLIANSHPDFLITWHASDALKKQLWKKAKRLPPQSPSLKK